MTLWLDDLRASAAGAGAWQAVRAVAPEAWDALVRMRVETCGLASPVLVELCRLRLATLLGSDVERRARCPRARAAGLDEDRIAALPLWPTDSRFSDLERAAIRFTEEYAMDVNAISDEAVDDLVGHLGVEQTYAFVCALWTVDAVQRAWMVMGIDDGLDALALEPVG